MSDKQTGRYLAETETEDELSLRERLERFEHHLLLKFFELSKGNVSEMPRRLRTDRAKLHRKLQRYRIKQILLLFHA